MYNYYVYIYIYITMKLNIPREPPGDCTKALVGVDPDIKSNLPQPVGVSRPIAEFHLTRLDWKSGGDGSVQIKLRQTLGRSGSSKRSSACSTGTPDLMPLGLHGVIGTPKV